MARGNGVYAMVPVHMIVPRLYWCGVTYPCPPFNNSGNAPTTAVSAVCPKCGITTSGKLSCCFRGGSWFRKCGDANSPNFEHTWFEGIQSCRSAISLLSKAHLQGSGHESMELDSGVVHGLVTARSRGFSKLLSIVACAMLAIVLYL